MRFSPFYIAICLFFALSLSLAGAEEAPAAKPEKKILESVASSVFGISLSYDSANGISQHCYGIGAFIEVEGDKTSYMLVTGDLYSDGRGNPRYNVYLNDAIVSASLNKTDPETFYCIIKLDVPFAKAVPLSFANPSRTDIGEQIYALYALPQAYSFAKAVRKASVAGEVSVGSTKFYTLNTPLTVDSMSGALGAFIFDKNGSLLGSMAYVEYNNRYFHAFALTPHVNKSIKALFASKKAGSETLDPSEAPGWLGVTFSPNSATVKRAISNRPEQDYGVFVSGVLPNSPADKSSIKLGDLILSVNDIKLKGIYSDITAFFASLKAGETADISLIRFNDQAGEWMNKKIQMTVERRPPTVDEVPKLKDEFFKVEFCSFTPDLKVSTYILDRFNGAYITKVEDDSVLRHYGIVPGTLVIKIGDKFTPDAGSLKSALAELNNKFDTDTEFMVCTPDGYNRPVVITVHVVKPAE